MVRRALLPCMLVALVSVPAFLVGEKLRHGETSPLMLATLWTLLLMVVLVASAIMRQLER